MPKIKRTTLTNEQKLLVLKYKDSNPNATHVNVAQWVKTTLNLDIHPTTVGHLLKRNDIKALDIVSHYFLQQSQDMSEYIGTISKIMRNLQVTSLQQTNLELFFNSNSL